jgi:hypothetical protein
VIVKSTRKKQGREVRVYEGINPLAGNPITIIMKKTQPGKAARIIRKMLHGDKVD